jgi:hypothetical protein
VIEKLWIDPLENDICGAIGYKLHSFVSTEKEAIEICGSSKEFTRNDCWAIWDKPVKEFKYTPLNYYKNDTGMGKV